jgi:hypothetical protein
MAGLLSERLFLEVTEDVHHQAIALHFPCRDNELKGRAQRARPTGHLIAKIVVLGVE